jgi:hypothetical protein
MNVIVTTTINPPTEGVRGFDQIDGWHLVVVGDKKTPDDYSLENGTYLSPDDQEAMDGELSEILGWNCIQRRNFGFIWAKETGAEVVATVDDDNIPLPGWGGDLTIGREVEVSFYETELPAFDPLGATNHSHLWHRGYPIQLLPRRDYTQVSLRRVRPQVQADLWNGHPDIDAICRMEHDPWCDFEGAFPIASNAIAPFNSQNTFLSADLLGDYFVFPGVGRMDDIWGGFYLQGVGANVVFNGPSVLQDRNGHDLIDDMRKEYLGYENNLSIVENVRSDPDIVFNLSPPETRRAFELYRKHFF